MNVLNVQQGSAEWLAARGARFTASEAPAMMGVSKYQTRSDLLRQKATGITADVDGAKQALFDKGHESEAAGRPLAEEITGDLYPVTATLEVEGLSLLASLDGATMMEDEIFEHKLYSQSLAAQVEAGALEPHYTVQMDQQLLVSGARRCLFMTSDGTRDRMAWCWYETTPEKIAALLAGWKQFATDLAAYEVPAATAPAPVGKAPAMLPALHIEVTGQVTTSNLAQFKTTALAAIRGVNRELKTDEDFADAEKAVRWCSDVEQRLAAGKDHALSQTATIDALFRAIDEISAEARQVRLDLEKLVKARKEAIKGEIVAGGIAALAEHLRSMNCPYLPRIAADFAGAAKNKRTVASLQDAVDTELARVKIEANGHYQRIQQNLQKLEQYKDHASLFADVAALVLKAPEDLLLVIRTRIDDDMRRKEKLIEAERERIRAEEQIKAEAKARADAVAAAAPAPVLPAPPPPAGVIARGESPAGNAIITKGNFPAPLSGAVKADEPATLNLGAMSERLQFTVPGALMTKFGIDGVPGPRGSRLYTESQFGALCAAIVDHVIAVEQAYLLLPA